MKRLGEILLPIGKNISSEKTNTTESMSQDTDCNICGGLGWISADVPVGHPLFGKLIPCPHRQNQTNRAKVQDLRTELGELRHLTQYNFLPEGHGGTPEQRASLKRAYEWLFVSAGIDEDQSSQDIKSGWVDNPRNWVLIQGGYGCGKTHLAAAIANACLSRGMPVLFVNVPDLLDYLRAAYSPSAEETYDARFSEVRNTPILILDDLGTQNATPWAEEKLYQILNARYVAKLPTVITTNLDLDDLDPRLRSRLSDQDVVRKLQILAPDFRRNPVEQEQSSISSLSLYHDKIFETFNPRTNLPREERSNLQEALRLSEEFAEQPRGWLVFIGEYGTGKTHLAAAIANYQATRGYEAMFVVVPDLLDHLRAAFSPDARTSFDQRFEEVRTTPLLVLDDLGTESATPWAREKLYQIINHRYVAKLPTVITTSVSPDDLDPRIRTRIVDDTRCKVFNLIVPSYRGGHDPRPTLPKPTRTTRGKR